MSDALIVAAIQLNAQEDVGENLAVCEQQVAAAAERGASLVVLPENFAHFAGDTSRASVAESLLEEGPILSRLRAAARRHHVIVVGGGLPEKSADPQRPYNTCVVVGAAGELLARYRKVHLFDVTLEDGSSFAESTSTTAGDDPVVFEWGGLRVGLSICYDLRFPELYRRLAREGANVLLVPAAFTELTGRDHWHVLLRARAIENLSWVVAANQWGEHPRDRRCYGHSVVIDPWGRVVAEQPTGVGLALAALDPEAVARTRQRMPCLEHRRLP